jgi:hypothetical protein
VNLGESGCRTTAEQGRGSFGICSAFVRGSRSGSVRQAFGVGWEQSRAAALLELAAAATRARLIAADGRRCGNRRRGWSEVLPSSLFPKFLAFEFSALRFVLPAFGGFLLFEHLGIPQRFPFGELLRRDGFSRTLAPDFIILLHPTLRALPGRTHLLGRDALSAPVGLVLLAASVTPQRK